MNSRLAWGLGFCLFLLAGRPVLALAPTDMAVESGLNQPLKARIELLNASAETLADLKVRQVQPVAAMLDLRFQIERGEAGHTVVLVTTAGPVQEPALNFVLEFEWPSGRLLREYSILLDPH